MQAWAETQFVQRVRASLARRWQRWLRLREQLQLSEEAFHLLLAGGVGVIGGLVNLVWYRAIEFVKWLVLRRPGDQVEIAEELSLFLRVLIPTLGGLVAGLVLQWGLRLVGRQGSTNMLEVVVAGDGRLPLRTGLVKSCSSLISIATGSSIGREGAITQLAATLASKWGQWRNWPPYRLRLLVGCGAASGIAATYNVPITGAIFASMVVLGNFSMHLFAPLAFASVVATMITRSFFGIEPLYELPRIQFTQVLQLPWFILLGGICGAMGAAFQTLLRQSERLFERVPLPLCLRLALGGLAVGLIALVFPGVWGNGYVITNRILHESFPAGWEPMVFLAGLVLAKLLATVAAVGSGAVGGVFTPTLFLGAGVGLLFGYVLQACALGLNFPAAAFGAVGMSALMAATTRSPLLAMILVFEISLDYELMPPLMLACVVAVLVARRFVPDSIYTEPLRAKGRAVVTESERLGVATERTVGDLMRAPVPPVRDTMPLSELANRFLTGSNNFIPIVDASGRLVGVAALQDLKEFLNSGHELGGVIAFDVMRPPPRTVTPGQRLLDVLPIALASEQMNIPVVSDAQEARLVGALRRAEVLGLFAEAIDAGHRPGV